MHNPSSLRLQRTFSRIYFEFQIIFRLYGVLPFINRLGLNVLYYEYLYYRCTHVGVRALPASVSRAPVSQAPVFSESTLTDSDAIRMPPPSLGRFSAALAVPSFKTGRFLFTDNNRNSRRGRDGGFDCCRGVFAEEAPSQSEH